MRLSILQNATRAVWDPFPHVHIEQALPDDIYTLLMEERPSDEQILNGRDPGNNIRCDRQAHDLLDDDISPIWRQFIEYHTSTAFWLEIIELFGPQIAHLYPDLQRKFGRMRDWPTGMRFVDNKLVSLECQVGINTPVLETSAVRGSHVDNPVELFAGLLYMRPASDLSEGGDLLIQRPKGKVSDLVFKRKAELNESDVETVKTVKYSANNFVGFINHPGSIHAVTPRQAGAPARLLVNFCAELIGNPLFQLRRS